MTAETVLTRVMVGVGLEPEAPSIVDTDIQTQQIVELINETGRDLITRAEWSQLFKTETIAAAATTHALPADFHRLAEGGPVRLNATGFNPVRRAMSADQWAIITAKPPAQRYFYIANGNLNFSSAIPTGGATLRYLSKHWTDAGETVTQNGDNLLIPERLVVSGAIYRWRRDKGFPYDDHLAAHEAEIMDEIRMDRGLQ